MKHIITMTEKKRKNDWFGNLLILFIVLGVMWLLYLFFINLPTLRVGELDKHYDLGVITRNICAGTQYTDIGSSEYEVIQSSLKDIECTQCSHKEIQQCCVWIGTALYEDNKKLMGKRNNSDTFLLGCLGHPNPVKKHKRYRYPGFR